MYGRAFLRCGAAVRAASGLGKCGLRVAGRAFSASSPLRQNLPSKMMWSNPGPEAYTWGYSQPMVYVKYCSLATTCLATTVAGVLTFSNLVESSATFRASMAAMILVGSVGPTIGIIFLSKSVVHRMFYTPESKRIIVEIRGMLNQRQRIEGKLSDIQPKSRALGNITMHGRPLFISVDEVQNKELFEKILSVAL
eukprot:scpid69239/ scgid7194/ 